MAPRNIDIYFDVQRGILLTSAGATLVDSQLPRIYYQEEPLVRLRLVNGSISVPYTGLDASQVFSCAVAADLNHDSAPMCRTGNTGINVSGDWTEASAVGGKFSVRINADTDEFDTTVDGKLNVRAYFEFKAYDSNGDLQFSALFVVSCFNLIDPVGSPSPGVDNDFTAYDARFIRRRFPTANFRASTDGNALQLWDSVIEKWRSLCIVDGSLALTTDGED